MPTIYRFDVKTLDKTGWDYAIDTSAMFSLETNENADFNKPWFEIPVSLKGSLIDRDGNNQLVKLVPEGCTILRRVTFPHKR